MTDYSINSFSETDSPFPFAALLEKEEIAYLGQLVEWHSAKAGDCLWREGDLSDRLGLVLRGKVKLLKESAFQGHPIVLGLFGAGSLIVDLSFAQGDPAEASAYAVDDVQLVFLSREQFDGILMDRPRLANSILNEVLCSIADQLRHTYRRLNAFF
jgi:CRP/FNR family transcriptional regulator